MNCTMWKELQYQNQFPKFYIACDKFVSLNECVRVLTAPDSKGGWLDIKAGDWQLDGGDCPPLHLRRRNQVNWNQQLKLGYSLRYFHLYLFYSFYMCKWSDVTLNESFLFGHICKPIFFRVCFEIWQFGYWRYKDMHTYNAEILSIQRHAQLQCWGIGNSKTFIVHWPRPARVHFLTGGWKGLGWRHDMYFPAQLVWYGLVMVWYGMGDMARRYIRRTLVLGGHTIRMGGRRYIILWFGNVNCYYDYE